MLVSSPYLIATLVRGNDMPIALALVVLFVVMARRQIINRLRAPYRDYCPSRFIEMGIFISVFGVLVPMGLAEGGFLSYRSEIIPVIVIAAIMLGLSVAIFGLGKELKQNTVR